MAKRRHGFVSALGPETEEQIKLANTIRHLEVVKNSTTILFQNSWYTLIASSISFHLI